jgi:hypothetical protein
LVSQISAAYSAMGAVTRELSRVGDVQDDLARPTLRVGVKPKQLRSAWREDAHELAGAERLEVENIGRRAEAY